MSAPGEARFIYRVHVLRERIKDVCPDRAEFFVSFGDCPQKLDSGTCGGSLTAGSSSRPMASNAAKVSEGCHDLPDFISR